MSGELYRQFAGRDSEGQTRLRAEGRAQETFLKECCCFFEK